MNLVILPQAAAELRDAIEYYEGEQSGLGKRFWGELETHLRWITQNAALPRLRKNGDYRRVNLKIFPYYVAYAIREQAVVILAISHASRMPEHWIKK